MNSKYPNQICIIVMYNYIRLRFSFGNFYTVGVYAVLTGNPFRLKVRNDRRTKISTANLSSGLNGVCQETFQGGPPSVFLWHQNPI